MISVVQSNIKNPASLKSAFWIAKGAPAITQGFMHIYIDPLLMFYPCHVHVASTSLSRQIGNAVKDTDLAIMQLRASWHVRLVGSRLLLSCGSCLGAEGFSCIGPFFILDFPSCGGLASNKWILLQRNFLRRRAHSHGLSCAVGEVCCGLHQQHMPSQDASGSDLVRGNVAS